MRRRKCAALLATTSLAIALLAGSASAVVTTEAAQWYTGSGTGTTLAGDQALTATVGTHPTIGTKFQLLAEIGATPFTLTATGLECVECKITNAEVTSRAGKVAMGKYKIKLTGVTVDTPTGCTVRNGAGGAVGVVETKPLVIHADWMHEGKAFLQFNLESGSSFGTVYIEGGNCAGFSGPYSIKGSLFAEAKNATGVQASSQELVFSQAIQETTGAELKLGSKKLGLTGTAIFSIGGTAFGVH
jgi:hypothetical protein